MIKDKKYKIDVCKKNNTTIMISILRFAILGILICTILTQHMSLKMIICSVFALISLMAFIFIITLYGSTIYLKLRFYSPIVIVPFIALVITYYLVSNWSDEMLTKAEILGFAGQFLAFSGAFCLGFFIFANEKEKRYEKQSDDINYLEDIIQRSVIDCISLRNMVQEVNSDDELRGRINAITTDRKWYYYYCEYEKRYGVDAQLKHTMDIHFNRIDKINNLINEGLYIKANDLSQYYIKSDYYNTMQYNPSNLIIEYSTRKMGRNNNEIWFEQKETANIINEICEQYYDIIETLIYNYMKKNGFSTMDSGEMNIIITEQLLQQCDYFKEIARFPTEKRIITKAIEECSHRFNSSNGRIKLIWGEYFLRDEDNADNNIVRKL